VLGVLAGPGSGAIADAIALFKLARARRPLPGLDAGAFARFVWTAIFDFLLATPAPAGLATLARHLASELARRHGMPPAEAARWFQAEPGTPVRTGTLDAIAPAHAAGAIGAGPAPAPSEPLRAGQGQAAALACLLLHGAAPPAVTPGALAMWLATIDDATWREVLRRYGSREPLLRRVASGLGAAVRDTAVRLAAGPELQSVQELIAALSAAGRHLTLDSAAEFSAALHYCLLASLLAGGASPSHPRLSLRGLILSVVRALAVRYRKPSRVLLAAAIDACGSDRLRPALRLAYHTHARAGAPAAAPTGPRATLELALHYLEFGVVPEAATGASTAAVLQQLNSGALLNAGARLAAPLRAMPCKEVVAQRLLRNLPARHRRRLLQLLAPTSAGLLESLLLASASGARLLDGIAPHTLLSCHWEQMLCMLLHAEAGAWQGRRLLEEMAQRVARQLGLPRDVYLAAMRGAAGQQARAQQRFEPLLDLLSQLPPAAGERPGPRTGRGARVAVETAAPPACAALAAFLRYGSTPAGWRGTPAQLVDAALEQEPEALRRIVLEAAGHVLERARLAQLLSDAQLQKILPGLLGQQYPAVSLCLGALCASRATGDDGAPYREALLQQLQPGDGARFSLAAFAGAAARRARSEHGVAEEQLLARARQSLHGSTGAGHEHVRAALAQAARACEQRELAEEYGWTALAPFDAPDGRDGTADRSPRPPSPVLPADQPFRVPNAGLVLLWQYMHPYFSALGLLAGRAFAGPPQQQRAACLLQLLACGSMRAPEHDLLLNKLLCGVEAGTPLACDTALTEQERTLADQLLYSITQHWRPLNNTSLDVLRATFLMREGSLVRQEEHWTLAVAAGPYDMLLQSLPWQVSTIRLPWMSAALQVQWKGRGT
jgi:hypothetical protein